MEPFISRSSIVRKIWSTTDITLFIFAGASAEFALNREVDWLFFTGKLPGDPIGRFFSTIQYAQSIIFSKQHDAFGAIESINSIHKNVESSRGKEIPAEAYKDVLYMLIYYSIVSFEMLERPLTEGEKDEIVRTFYQIGTRMHLRNLPGSYASWAALYAIHLNNNLKYSEYTRRLFLQYRKHLGVIRYFMLLDIQRMLVSSPVNNLLQLGKPRIAERVLFIYKVLRKSGINRILLRIMVPKKFHKKLKTMEQVSQLNQYG